MPDAKPHILIVEPSYLGDVILGLPVLNALYQSYGALSVSVLVRAGHESLFTGHPAVAGVIIYRPTEIHKGVVGTWRLSRELRGRGLSTALVFPGSIKAMLAVWLARIPRRIGADPRDGFSSQLSLVRYPDVVRSLPHVRKILLFERAVRWMYRLSGGKPQFFTDVIPQPPNLHAVDKKLLWLGPLGISAEGAFALPWLHIADASVRRNRASSGQRMVALAPGATWETRRWPEERFVALADLLEADGFIVCILGGQKDLSLARRIESAATSPRVVSVAGALSLVESMALIQHCNALVANDTAPVHMASAMGTPTVALFGPTLPSFGFAPRAPRSRVLERSGLSCRPCTVYGSRTCPVGTLECLTSITVEEVHAAVLEIVGSAIKTTVPVTGTQPNPGT